MDADIHEFVRRTRAASGVPETITDLAVAETIARLLRERGSTPPKRGRTGQSFGAVATTATKGKRTRHDAA